MKSHERGISQSRAQCDGNLEEVAPDAMQEDGRLCARREYDHYTSYGKRLGSSPYTSIGNNYGEALTWVTCVGENVMRSGVERNGRFKFVRARR
jgi:hypothetical protein